MDQIENIEIRFSGSANFKQVYAEVARMNAQLQGMQANIAKLDDSSVRNARNTFNMMGRDLGGLNVEAIKAKSATQAMTEAIVKQELRLRDRSKVAKQFNSVLREQYQLQKMTAVQWSKSASGTVAADVLVPKGVDSNINRLTSSLGANVRAMRDARAEMIQYGKHTTLGQQAASRFAEAQGIMKMRMGMATDVLGSYSANMVKWGKNTQWAGRQLMVGFTVPFAAFAAVAGMAAYNVDKEMTRILRVYDYSSRAAKDSAARDAEANRVRTISLENAKDAAAQYGVSVKDTLAMEAELAATGLAGNELIKRTTALNRARIIGELDMQQALKASTALQTAYGHQTEQINTDLDYMSAIADATSLSMSDFVAALPRGAATLKNVGVNLQDLGVLMVALKQGGVEAGEGMNSLRSSAQKLLQPVPKAEKLWAQLLPNTKSIKEIVDMNKGQFIPTLKALGNEMKSLDVYNRQKIITNLFGIQRADNMMKVMDGLINRTNQVGKAMDVANQSEAQWATRSAAAFETVYNSASNKIQRAVEVIKAQLVDLGAEFLPIAADLMQLVGGAIKFVNGLSSIQKGTILWGAGLMAAAGVLTMLVGLTSNFIGTLGGLITWIAKSRTSFRTMTLAQKTEQMMAESTSKLWNDQGLAAATLSSQLRMLTSHFEQLTIAQKNAALAQELNGGVIVANQSRNPAFAGMTHLVQHTDPQTGRTWRQALNPAQQAAHTDLVQTQAAYAANAAAAQRMQVATAVTKRNWGGIAAGAGGAAMMTGMIVANVNKGNDAAHSLGESVMNIGLMAAMVGPMMAKGLQKAAGATALTQLKNTFTLGRAGMTGGVLAGRAQMRGGIVQGIKAATPAARALASAMAGWVIPIAALGGSIMIYKAIRRDLDETRKKQDELTNSSKDWAKVLGFAYTTASANFKVQKTEGQQAMSFAGKFREANKEATKGLDIAAKAKNNEDLLNLAIQEGTKARLHGANAGQARLATETALAAAGKKGAELQNLMVKVDAQIDFGNLDAVAERQGQAFGQQFSKAMEGQLETEGFWGKVWQKWTNSASAGTKEAGKNAGQEFWNALDALNDPTKQKEFFEKQESQFKNRSAAMMKDINDARNAEAKRQGVNKPQQLTWDSVTQAIGNDPNGFQSAASDLNIPDKYMSQLQEATTYQKEFVQNLATQAGLSPKVVAGLSNMTQLHKALGIAEYTQADAMKNYDSEIAAATANGKKLSEAEKLQILNKWRIAAGLDGATTSAQGFGAALQGASGAVDQFGKAIDSNVMSAEEWGKAWADATKNAMSGAHDAMLAQADNLMGEQDQAALDAISAKADKAAAAEDAKAEKQNKKFENRADAMDKKFDRQNNALENKQKARQKAVADAYDARIKKVQDAIDAEDKAEAERQRIFEAEKTRMERMAEMANKNIDFNVAINTGNLDEAAKQFNDIQQTTTDWAISDATAGSQSASDARKAQLQSKADGIGKQKDAAIEALNKRDDAEKQALKDKQDREKKALDAEKERYAKSVEANKKAIKDKADADKKAMEVEIQNRKNTLAIELAAVRASVPRNAAEYNAQVKAVEKIYDKYGLNLQSKGNQWTGYIAGYLKENVAKAAASMKNDIAWGSYAAQIADDFAKGAFGMDMNEFGDWIRTGKVPHGAFNIQNPTDYKHNRSQAASHSTGSHAVRGAHTGGYLGNNSQNLSQRTRKGVPLSAGLYPSEVGLIAKKDEYVMSGKAVRQYGVGVMDDINSGKYDPTAKGGGDVGLAGIVGGGLAAMLRNAMQMAVLTAGIRKMQADGGFPDASGAKTSAKGLNLSPAQIKNAQTIMSVGRNLGASKRDMTVALMTAMQESSLQNLSGGDADSLGLFQQRPSQGWGTPEQIMNPQYASTKFYRELFKVKDRTSMPLTMVAQAVQRSAFPMAYAKWQGIAESLVNGTTFKGGNGMGLADMMQMVAGGLVPGKGGLGKPIAVGQYNVSSEYGMRVNPVTGVYKLHDGIDLAAAAGTPIHAVKAGKVLSAGPAGGYGNYTIIQHGDGTRSGYAHQSKLNVSAGQMVSAGQVIGLVGTTGNSTGNHLHFQMSKPGGAWENPRDFIPGLRKGGFTLNDGYAMLHKNETVLTADLSEKLNAGLNNLANGDTNKYTISVDMRGSNFSKEIDVEAAIEKGVVKALNAREGKYGRSRTVTGRR